MSKRVLLMLTGFGCLLFLGFGWFSSEHPIRNAVPSGENVICFGDSLTYGTGATQGMDYPTQLSRKLSKPVINAGVPGDTTDRALSRLEKDVLDHSPRIVMITLGGNDLRHGVPKDAAFRNLKTIVESIQERGALVVVGGIEIPVLDRGFGEGYKALCKEVGAVLIPNIFEGIMGNQQMMSDAIHPNDAGYSLIAERFYIALQPYLQ